MAFIDVLRSLSRAITSRSFFCTKNKILAPNSTDITIISSMTVKPVVRLLITY